MVRGSYIGMECDPIEGRVILMGQCVRARMQANRKLSPGMLEDRLKLSQKEIIPRFLLHASEECVLAGTKYPILI